MRRGRTSILLALVLAPVGAACVLGIDPLPGAGSTAPPTIDAAPDASPAFESGPGSPADAGAADVRVEAEAGRFCETLLPGPKVCEDFDGPSISSDWKRQVDPGTSATVDDGGARSGAQSFLVTTDNSAKQTARLSFAIPAAVRKLHVTQDLRVDLRGGYAETAYVFVGPAAFLLRLPAAGGVPQFTAEAFPPSGEVPQHNVDIDAATTFEPWTHLDVQLDFGASPPAMTVRVDGAVVVAQDLEPDLYASAPAEVQVGIGYVDGDGKPWRVRFDNVTIDWE